MDNLTYREKQIITYLDEGLTNRAIGLKINASEKTVEKTLQNIYDKLNIPSRRRTQLLSVAYKSNFFQSKIAG